MADTEKENIINDVISYLPEDERPDMTQLKNYFYTGLLNPKITYWNGFRFLPRFNAETAKFAYEMTYKNSDVIVAAFPKAAIKFEVVNKLPLSRRVFATHLDAQLVNLKKIKESGAKVIYCIRNPKDQAVSWYHMYQNIRCIDHPNFKEICPKTWEEFFNMYTSGKQPLFTRDGGWYPDHVMSWYQYRDDVMFVVYEEMKRNPVKQILRIAEFLHIPATLERAEEIASMTSFSKMSAELKDRAPADNFYRKGEVGDWKNYFSDEQSKIMDELIQEKLGNTGIKFIYE